MVVEECVCEPPLNGFACGIHNDAAEGSSGEGLRTYKRRKQGKFNLESKVQEPARICMESQIEDQTMRESDCVVSQNNNGEQATVLRVDCHSIVNGSDNISPRYWRNLVLEKMSQSLHESEGGIQGCIREAIVFRGQNDDTVTFKTSADKDSQKYFSPVEWMPSGCQNAAERNGGVTSNGSQSEPNHHTVTQACQCIFSNIIVSEKFAALCKLLLENFEGIKVDRFFDYSLINARMKEGAYESSPMLFFSDLQQIWRELQKIGAEMVSLAKNLSDMSRSSYYEEVGASRQDISEEGKHKFCTQVSDCHTKPEQSDAFTEWKVCTCRCCGEKACGRECLVCDSCEEMYHVCCIEPAVTEIPHRNWYCAKCTATGIGSPHENCVVCERLNTRRTLNDGVGDVKLTDEETLVEVEENSSNCIVDNGVQQSKGIEKSCICKVCKSEIGNGEKFWRCGHSFCPNKYYHVRCLTSKQLKSYGPHWYCPSCLCRVCLTDQDDDKIVLCDACDHAYHIYCMEPPRASIPRGKWFCRKCNAGIQKIRKAKRAYEILENKRRMGEEGKIAFKFFEKKQKNGGVVLDKAVGVDMLLNAANTLKIEEKLAAIREKS